MKLSESKLKDESVSQTGLKNFGCPSHIEALEQLVHSLNHEADLNEAGEQMFHARILNSLKNRLRMEAWIERHPEILEEQLEPPVVIVGLPRTGTTMLHRVLASDSRFFAPLWYEVRNPAPYMDWQPGSADQRLLEARAEVDALLAANPELAAIHPMDPEGADEEILLLEHSFYSYTPNAFANLPGYGDWVASHDNRPAYQYLKRQLQFLQWQKKRRGEQGQRWLLKSPHHLHFMEVLLETFPAATVVATHRDPVITIPSIASFHYNLWLTTCDNPDKHHIARQWSAMFARGIEHTLAVRAAQEERFFDVQFDDSTADPFGVIERLYEFIDLQLTPQARAAMNAHREQNKREDRAAHAYTLEEYGLSENQIRQDFAAYCRRFVLA